MDFIVAGCAAVSAGFFTNPLEVIKTRLQLQGELRAKGQHVVHYRNALHASYQIAKHDGILALQKGLVPALWVQLIMNGARLGGFQFFDNRNLIRDKDGNMVFYRSAFFAGLCGVCGHYLANPMFLIKTQKQSQAAKAIAVGHQHKSLPLWSTLVEIIKTHGGLYKGGMASLPRAFVASSAQLLGFSYAKQFILREEYFQTRPLLTSFCSSFVGGIAISVLVTPFDLILTRLYNQGVGADGKGLLYNGYFDCVSKVYHTEGLRAFYKGIGPMYMRLGPHTVLTLVFWDIFKDLQHKYTAKDMRSFN
ncbi:PREDICTED: solute carrier family 25 member 35-like isoform X2 [Nicrophorus vespilloides]|uniref:Solute carrier family 25 member 35-like isoform X2 n=1 Tax=Nicrophorus vespilloides TaxID=110193 RepID=A0ABM1MRB1_NICVS|nr:PREDICTED: solute carrier family 25 member 35-like isoform X2 [Nicrophorus vespilloides]